jgi:hypothetical protein
MKHPMSVATVLAFVAATFAQPALAAGKDGTLLLYPHGAPVAGMSMPANALAQGVPYQLTTADSVDTVDRWYASNAPKSCSRMAASGGVRYKCPGGTIVIQSHGQTLISFVPSMSK